MIETLLERPDAIDIDVPADVSSSFVTFQKEISGRSQIVWGEHCSECAYPSCYAHCAFYTPRSDFNCRRFEAGLEPVMRAPSLRRVRFRKWGKLEGRGPSPVMPAAMASRRDRQDAQVSGLLAAAPAPYALKQNLAWRWNTHKQAARPTPSALKADAFVVEAWASNGEPHAFTLTILNIGEHGGRLFQTRFDVDGTYLRLVVPVVAIAAQVDLEAPYLVQIEPVGEAQGVEVVFGVCDFVALRPSPASAARDRAVNEKPAKVVVWDLDETLWTGVLVEDGVGGVRPRPEAVAAIKILDERGVLQSVASKNSTPEALAALRAFGLVDYFLHPQVHWNPKSGSIAALAKALNLGLDSIVFIDDQPFERAEVEAAHPAVRTLPHTAVAGLTDHPWFDLPITAESRGRRGLYQQEAQRTEAYEGAGADYASFLRASEIKLSVDQLTAADVERVFELSQRTNQLNFTGRKYTREEVQTLLTGSGDEIGLCLRCSDRFGDYGLIGFAVAQCSRGVVSEFFMSCRVQRKRVEQAFFAWLGWKMATRGVRDMPIAYVSTGRNGAALEMLNSLGFAQVDGQGCWSRPTAQPVEESDIVAIVAHSAAKAAA